MTTRTAVVTGAGRGIGRAIAERLARDGMNVVAVDLNEELLTQTVESLNGGGKHTWLVSDVTNEDQVRSAAERAIAEYGGIDVLVTAAGVHSGNYSIEDLELENWNRTMAINATGTFLWCKAVAGSMQERGWGRIVTIASINGKEGNAYATAYNASKHAVVGLTTSLAVELAPHGITVNAVCPGPADTELLRGAFEKRSKLHGVSMEEQYAAVSGAVPMKRLAQPQDIANAVSFLASDDASYVTRETLAVAGGLRFVS